MRVCIHSYQQNGPVGVASQPVRAVFKNGLVNHIKIHSRFWTLCFFLELNRRLATFSFLGNISYTEESSMT